MGLGGAPYYCGAHWALRGRACQRNLNAIASRLLQPSPRSLRVTGGGLVDAKTFSSACLHSREREVCVEGDCECFRLLAENS